MCVPVSSSIPSPPRMYHQAVSAAPVAMPTGQPMLQGAGGPYIAASMVNYGPPGVPPGIGVPQGVAPPPPGHFPLAVQFTNQTPNLPVSMV